MIRRPPVSTRTDTLFPYSTLFRSSLHPFDFCLGGSTEEALELAAELRGAFVPYIERRSRNRHCITQHQQSRLVQARRLQILHRSEEHTSELQSLMRISYAVFCLKKKKHTREHTAERIQQNQI